MGETKKGEAADTHTQHSPEPLAETLHPYARVYTEWWAWSMWTERAGGKTSLISDASSLQFFDSILRPPSFCPLASHSHHPPLDSARKKAAISHELW